MPNVGTGHYRLVRSSSTRSKGISGDSTHVSASIGAWSTSYGWPMTTPTSAADKGRAGVRFQGSVLKCFANSTLRVGPGSFRQPPRENAFSQAKLKKLAAFMSRHGL